MKVSSRTRDLALAAAAAVASLILYCLTLQPDFGGPEDTPKFQFIGYVLGIPHPPGYPLYVLLSHLFSALPVGTVAYRANLFSAVLAALACALSYAMARQLGASRWPAFFAALALATGASFWRSAVFAEVYSLAAVMAGLTISLLLAWGARGGTRRLVGAFGAFAFGLGNHLTIIGVVPAFAAYVLTRGRRIWSARMVAASAVVLALGLAQYGLIMLRTHQRAPYVEIGAFSVRDLIGVITAERFADQRFAFSLSVQLTEHLPALVVLIARELGVAGTVLFLVGAVAGIRRPDTALALGASAGMFAMVLNISGDLKGFITPLMVLLWPVAATGIDTVARYARLIPGFGRAAGHVAIAAAVLLPLANLSANHSEADQSGNTAEARFVRAAFRQLPDGSRFVTQDYWSGMAWRYYQLTGEAGPFGDKSRIEFDAAAVRRAATEGRDVFGFAFAATFLAAEGLHFRREPVPGPPLGEWLGGLPRGSLLVAATAYAPFPADLSVVGHSHARPPGRPRSFEALALVVGEPGQAWRTSDDRLSLDVNAESVTNWLPPTGRSLIASAGAAGAYVDLDGHAMARVDRGVALAVFAPDGTPLRTMELPPGAPERVEFSEALYRLAGEAACALLTTDRWTDIEPVLASGGWIATLPSVGSIVIETVADGTHDLHVRSTVLLGDGEMRTTVAGGPASAILTTRLTRAGESRPVFRLALDRPPPAARARLQPGGTTSSARVCAFNPFHPPPGQEPAAAVLRPDFESEPYFGAGWGDAQRTPAGPQRQGVDGATLFLPLHPGRNYRLALDLAAAEPLVLAMALNGTPLGTCDPLARAPCELEVPAAAVHDGLNRLSVRVPGSDAGSKAFTLRRVGITATGRSPRS